MSTPSYLDADAWDALSLGGTLVVRDAIVSGKPHLKKAGALVVGQYAYDKLLRSQLSGWAAGLSGESYYSALAANVVGLTGVFLVSDMLKLSGSASDPLGDGEGIIPDLKLKGKMSKKILNSAVDAIEIIVERQLLMSATSMLQSAGPAAGEPMPALKK